MCGGEISLFLGGFAVCMFFYSVSLYGGTPPPDHLPHPLLLSQKRRFLFSFSEKGASRKKLLTERRERRGPPPCALVCVLGVSKKTKAHSCFTLKGGKEQSMNAKKRGGSNAGANSDTNAVAGGGGPREPGGAGPAPAGGSRTKVGNPMSLRGKKGLTKERGLW